MPQLRDAALAYVSRGFAVFPCRPRSKVPITPRGCLDATTDVSQVEAWWAQHPDANIGLATGPVSGVDVVDVDANPKKGKVGWATFRAILDVNGLEDFDTVASRTPTTGAHLFVKACGLPSKTDTLGKDVDTRGAGGYVLVPPSVHPDGGEYEWLKDPFTNEPAEAPPWMRVQRSAPALAAIEWNGPDADTMTEAEVWACLRATQGERLAVVERMQSGEPLFESGKHNAEAWKHLNYMRFKLGRRVSDATLMRLLGPSVAAMGCADHGEPYFLLQLQRAGGAYAAAEAKRQENAQAVQAALHLDTPRELSAQAALDAFRGKDSAVRRGFTSAEELWDKELPKTPWVVRGLLPQDGALVVGGEPKASKTWVGMELSLSVAGAGPAFGQFLAQDPRPVAMFLAEDSERSVRTRLAALLRGRGVTDKAEMRAVLRRLHVQCRGSLDLQSDADLCWIIDAMRTLPERPSLLVLDPLRDLHTAEENDSGEMSAVMRNIRALRTILGCTVVFVHHTVKPSKEGAQRRPGQQLRGSGAIYGAVDGVLSLTFVDKVDHDTGSTFTNTSHVELKAARGAGSFELRLLVEDDSEGEAQVARWEYERKEAAVPVELAAAVVEVCRQDWVARGGAPRPVTTDAIQKHLHKRREAVVEALRDAEKRGQVRLVMQGTRALGYAYVESAP